MSYSLYMRRLVHRLIIHTLTHKAISNIIRSNIILSIALPLIVAIILLGNSISVYGLEKPFLEGLVDISKSYASFQVVVTTKQSVGNTSYTLRFYNNTDMIALFIVNGTDKSLLFTVPYNKDFKSVEIRRDDKILLFIPLNLCNHNNICDLNENYYSCPEDCLGALDNVCINTTDSVCDPDCGLKDKDCIMPEQQNLGFGNNTTQTQKTLDYKKQTRYIAFTIIILMLSIILLISAFKIKPKPSMIQ